MRFLRERPKHAADFEEIDRLEGAPNPGWSTSAFTRGLSISEARAELEQFGERAAVRAAQRLGLDALPHRPTQGWAAFAALPPDAAIDQLRAMNSAPSAPPARTASAAAPSPTPTPAPRPSATFNAGGGAVPATALFEKLRGKSESFCDPGSRVFFQ